MASGVPLFCYAIASWTAATVSFVFIIIEAVAVVNCLIQRADAFPVVGSLTKPAWLAILIGCLAATGCEWYSYSRTTGIGLFTFIAIIATAYYMLDVRPALRDAAGGSGSW